MELIRCVKGGVEGTEVGRFKQVVRRVVTRAHLAYEDNRLLDTAEVRD